MENMQLLEGLFDKKMLSVIRLLLANKDKGFYLQEMSKEANVPIATVYRIIGKLKELEIAKEIRVSKFRLYKCADNENVAFLEGFLSEGKRIIDKLVKELGMLANVEEIILHGKESEDKANILLIGKDIDSNEVKRIASLFKESHGFTVNSLSLERQQYEQMSAMGLYSGKKNVLFRRDVANFK